MKIAIIDNYDSFTYNLVHYMEQITSECPQVFRNDLTDLTVLDKFDCLVLSPGPGLPHEAGRLMEIINIFYQSKFILGVCLGHQALGVHFGGKLKNLPMVFHGESTPLTQAAKTNLYANLEEPIFVGRYHSWVVAKEDLPKELTITSVDEQGEIMSFEHVLWPLVGIQYHPESILTPQGMQILTNYFESISVK